MKLAIQWHSPVTIIDREGQVFLVHVFDQVGDANNCLCGCVGQVSPVVGIEGEEGGWGDTAGQGNSVVNFTPVKGLGLCLGR